MIYQDLIQQLERKGTHYEEENGLTIGEVYTIIDGDHIKLLGRDSSDGRTCLIIAYKPKHNVNVDNWFYWFPSEEQFNTFNAMAEIYNSVVAYNTNEV